MIRISRRATFAASLLLLPRPARAEAPVGEVAEVTGTATLTHMGQPLPMAPGDALAEGDHAETAPGALALLALTTGTRIHMGPETQLVLTRYLAEAGGTLSLGGAIVFDRDDSLPPVDLTFETAFGQIGVRGTRFFAGPSRGSFAVFCQRGRVRVAGAGVQRDLGPGEGVDMAAGAAPSGVALWGAPRIAEAFALVGLAP